MKLNIDGTEYSYSVRYINNRAVAIGYHANLAFADLTDAVLTFANLFFANLFFANLRGADLRGVKNLDSAYGLSTVKGKPASLPEGWTYTEGKGIHESETRSES